MDCMPMDDVCSMMNYYNNQIEQIIIEEKEKESRINLGTFNGRTYIFSVIDGEYVITVISEDKASPTETF